MDRHVAAAQVVHEGPVETTKNCVGFQNSLRSVLPERKIQLCKGIKGQPVTEKKQESQTTINVYHYTKAHARLIR